MGLNPKRGDQFLSIADGPGLSPAPRGKGERKGGAQGGETATEGSDDGTQKGPSKYQLHSIDCTATSLLSSQRTSSEDRQKALVHIRVKEGKPWLT